MGAAHAGERDQLNACQAMVTRAAQTQQAAAAHGPAVDETELTRCRQVIQEWTLRDSRMSVTMDHFVGIVMILLFFPAVFLLQVALTSRSSRWFRLLEVFPDQPVQPILQLRAQNGRIGGARMIGVLELGVCPTGLRVGLMWPLAEYWKDFFVPWESITVIRSPIFRSVSKLQFGTPAIGTLRIRKSLADRLATAAEQHWPERAISAGDTIRT
jgi:hypothetical protein